MPFFWAFALITHSQADEQDTFQLSASLDKMHDSNLFRQSRDESSDQATITTLGAKFNKAYALQKFSVDAYYIDNKYQKNDFLDYAAKNYSASWLWSLTPNLTGVISSSRAQRQINFRDLLAAVKNVTTTTQNTFRAEYSPFNVLSIVAGYSTAKSENSQQFNAQASNESMGLDYGVKYNFPSTSFISIMGHNRSGSVNGRPLNQALQFDTGYTENEYDLEFERHPSGLNLLNAKIGYVERIHDNFSSRDYKAVVGNLSFRKELTGKLVSGVGVSRNVGPYETSNSTLSITDSLNLSLNYTITSKIQAGVNLMLSEREFEGRGVFNTSGRIDKEHSYGANISWRPIKNIGFTLSATKSDRNSTISQLDFDDTLTSLNIDLNI